jgi:hypothetical protein
MHAALGYAARGWAVFPLHTPRQGDPGGCSCGAAHERAKDAGKHPRTRHGLTQASSDPVQVRSWWTRWPDANIGLATGVVFDVLDVDGLDSCDALDAAAPADAGPSWA